MRDRLFGECAEWRARETGLVTLFEKHGFSEVSTPILERYELFTRTDSPLSEEEMVKVIGRDGRICVLRPDNTAPIARLAVTRLQNEPPPLKLWYAQPVYRAGGDGCHEYMQAGAEVIGEIGDAELIALAAEAAAIFLGKKPQIEVSHAGVLDSILQDVTDQKRALSLIKRKNFAELGDEFSRDLLKLVSISGGREAVAEAEKITGKTFDELRGLVGGDITADFSLVPPLGYYTGVFFRGYAEGAAGAVLSGGRYDNLLGLLGRGLPAVGFAINME
jgi:ATP phosphoribosyltransferase regulatory subunit